MNKILIAVDDTKGTQEMFSKIMKICKCMNPEEIVLLYVEKIEGRSIMDEMLGDAEMSTLKEELEGTEFKKALDAKADKILGYYKNLMQSSPPAPQVRTVVRTGHPAEEIIKGSEEEGADMIIVGTRGDRIGRFFIGSVSREVVNHSKVPVLVVK
jgi:nucleotide-binding universal stress UspA family protein